ncbi:unnamed protein product, partial [Ectocarpus sp. 4 AP-2014]
HHFRGRSTGCFTTKTGTPETKFVSTFSFSLQCSVYSVVVVLVVVIELQPFRSISDKVSSVIHTAANNVRTQKNSPRRQTAPKRAQQEQYNQRSTVVVNKLDRPHKSRGKGLLYPSRDKNI